MGRLNGKVSFITGGGAGIARVAAQLFSGEGSAVVIVDINEETGSATQREIRERGDKAIYVCADISNEVNVQRAVELGVEAFGKIDILFNCAGGSLITDDVVTEVDLSRVWKHSMDVNLLGTIMCCRHVIPRIAAAGGGAVVNMSSAAALRGASSYHIYTAAKGAILSLTRAMAGAYVKSNIRVNAICAGRIQTERNVIKYGADGKGGGSIVDPQQAAERVKEYPFWLGSPMDIALIALFLASDESRMITGAAIPADGGRSAY